VALEAGKINGNTATLSRLGLAPHVLACLEAEGVRTLGDWLGLGRRRFRLFGVTRKNVEALNAAARKVRT
jgi:hypothetical protein